MNGEQKELKNDTNEEPKQAPTEPTRMADRYSSRSPRTLCSGIAVFFLLVGITALVLYLVYRPSKAHFSVVGAAVYELNVSSPAASTISTRMQFTVVVRNPNRRSSMFFDRLNLYVTYRSQSITPPTPIPSLYLEKDNTVAVSPVLGGEYVPVAGDVASGLMTDEAYGMMSLRVVVMGKVKYKAGRFHSHWYGMFVTCDLLVGVKKDVYGQVPMLGSPECHVDI